MLLINRVKYCDIIYNGIGVTAVSLVLVLYFHSVTLVLVGVVVGILSNSVYVFILVQCDIFV